MSGKLIVPPGAPDAGLVALDAVTGSVLWKSTNGRPAGYASPLVATLGGVRQMIFYDDESLGGWDIASVVKGLVENSIDAGAALWYNTRSRLMTAIQTLRGQKAKRLCEQLNAFLRTLKTKVAEK